MGTLNDLLQGTSKGFWAGGAGAPVDTLTLALNALIAGGGYAGHKMGLLNTPPGLIEKPVGGSEWIAEKMRSGGLLNDNPGSTADNFGNVIGGLLGPVTAAKAPQIARGLLQGGQNLAAPRTLNPQTGAIVWHGSPHKFDKFDSSKIGTGEGAQAYGHGLYLAESPAVAGAYKEALSEPEIFLKGRKVATSAGTPMDTAKAWLQNVYDRGFFNSKTANPFDQAIKDVSNAPVPNKEDVLQALQRLKASGAGMEKGGSLYKVDLPDEHIAKMLDWDKPLSQQHPAVQKALAKVKPDQYHPLSSDYDPMELGQMIHHRLTNDDKFLGIQPGARMSGAPGWTSNLVTSKLREAGIPGIRYLDGGSRGTGQGTSNFVVFPGNEGLLSILERNGKSIK